MKNTTPVQGGAAATSLDPRWTSVLTRDFKADGTFFYSVRTTGVYCRPSCASRPARPENVAFHSTTEDAERAGFRPCKRCKPEQPALAAQHATRIAEACRRIENAPKEPSLNDLAVFAQMSPSHFHRLFRAVTGLTPKRYASAHRGNSVRQQLKRSRTVTEAIYGAGFNSNGRFYATSNQTLGMTPSSFRAGGQKSEIRFAVGESMLGSILVAQSDRGICAILLGDDPQQLVQDLEDRFPRASLIGGDADFEQLVSKVVGFVEAPAIGLDLPLDIRGTAFQQRVWQALRELPAGATASYTDIAKTIGLPKSVRAVAQACATNALAVAIPCHRVVRSDGHLSGYRWGIERKRLLLEREAQC
jgi:AraC family transcriptional regulator, regulatory protein of adaptative response / methylated-DNA-[protein]-cysteine methyltransferase